MYLERLKFLFLALIVLPAAGCYSAKINNDSPDKQLKVVIIRHAEKPASGGDNLSCQGQNRAVKLPAVIYQKFGKPDYIYVPALKLAESTGRSRMFQTATPLAIKYDVAINSNFRVTDYAEIAESVLKKTGTVLMVWSHNEIPELTKALGVDSSPDWKKKDYDSIWVLTYKDKTPLLSKDQAGLNPSVDCSF